MVTLPRLFIIILAMLPETSAGKVIQEVFVRNCSLSVQELEITICHAQVISHNQVTPYFSFWYDQNDN